MLIVASSDHYCVFSAMAPCFDSWRGFFTFISLHFFCPGMDDYAFDRDGKAIFWWQKINLEPATLKVASYLDLELLCCRPSYKTSSPRRVLQLL